jgi:hypothetical protein
MILGDRMRRGSSGRQGSIGEGGSRINHGAVFAIKVGQRHGMNLVRGPETPVKVAARKGETCIFDEVCPESKVSRHAHRRLNGIVCGDSGDDNRIDRGLAQTAFEPGPDERAIGSLCHDGLPRAGRDLILELVAGLVLYAEAGETES